MFQKQFSSWTQFTTPKLQINPQNSPSVKSEQNSKDDIEEQQDMIIEENFIKVVGSNQNQRFESDFTVEDQDKRNILHQTALRQDNKVLEILIEDYKTLLKENKKKSKSKQPSKKQIQKKKEEDDDEEIIEIDLDFDDDNQLEIQAQIKKYVQQKDTFGCSPIQICCFLNDPKLQNNRQECLRILIENGSDVNCINPHSRWSPLHWCAFYGDSKSVLFLLEKKAHSFLCDNNGLYPMDLAGKNKNITVLRLLIDQIVSFLTECQQFWNSELKGKNENEFILFQEICCKYEAELQNPLLYTKILYWCCLHKLNDHIKHILINLPRIYIMFPIKSLEGQTCLHACCQNNNYEALKSIIKFEILDLSIKGPDSSKKKKPLKKGRDRDNYYSKPLGSYLEQIDLPGITQILQKRYLSIYKERYYHELERYRLQHIKYKDELSKLSENLQSLEELKNNKSFYDQTKEQFCKCVLQIDVKDNHGNTALHLASLNGDQRIIKFLLNKYADPEAENNEFFRARQLTKDIATQIYYDGLIKKKKYSQTQNIVNQSVSEIFVKHKQKRNKQVANFEDQYNLSENVQQKSKFYKTQLKTKKQDQIKQSIREQQTISQLQLQESEFEKNSEPLKASIQRENKKFLHKPVKSKKNTSKIVPLNPSPSSQQKQKRNSYNCLEQLILFSSQLFVPDIVLKLDLSVKNNLIDIFKRHKEQEIQEKKKMIDQQINFQLDLLQKAEFEIYMMQSFIQKSQIYVMLRLKEEKLERLAEETEMQIKLIDSYDLEQFKQTQRNKFEPFRSSQRQKIVYDHLIKSVNLESLLKSKLVESCYAMHTSGGIQIVKRQWQNLSYGFIPQPLSQIKDYLSEGKGRNFTSLTTMRLYFGEQISFYFAWISYLSCVQLIIAIPGLALQLYAIFYDFHSDIIPYWVLFVTIWSTVQIELWKRKTSEINTRWGCIDQMLQAESSYYEGPLKEKFSGDEEIHFITRKLTKHQQITKMAVYFIIFIFLIAVFLFCSFGIVYGIDLLRQELKIYKGFIFLLGALQAIAIQILNIIFLYFSKWYADQENHKYEQSYQKSLIYKNGFFRFINSYMPVIYIIVVQNDKYNLEDIFYFLIPLVLVKKAYYILVNFLIPVLLLRGNIKNYFRKVKNETINQKNIRLANNQHLLYLDEIEQFWDYEEFLKNQRESPEDSIQVDLLESAARPVLKIESEETLEEKIQEQIKNPKFKYMPFETKIDVDAIELNSLKDDFEGTLDYFMEAITDYGYFILFSAAFPIGPFIGIVMNTIDIQVKLYKLIYMTKRVKSERVPGIGQWLQVLEFLSATGVFTNFVLLYFMHRSATLRMFTDQVDYVVQNNLELWYFVSCVIAVSLIKLLVRELIPDRPGWVIEEIDKINHRQLVEQQQKTQNKLKDLEKHYKELKEESKNIKKEQGELETSTSAKIKQLDVEIAKLESQFFSISKYKKIDKVVMTEYDMIVLSVMKIRYYQIDNALIIKRILQLIEAKFSIISICQECGKNPTILECIECSELFCAQCYQKLHAITQQHQHNVNLLIKKNEILEQIELNVVIDKPNQKMLVNQQSKQLKQQIKVAEPKRCWKKIEYFYIPLQLQNGQPKLNQLYNQFGEYYLKGPGLEFRDFRIQVEKIIPIKDLILVDDSTLRIEDKIFLNRIAFFLFRKKKSLAEIQLFLKNCSILQVGQLEQKVILFFDLIDINEDEEITKYELENQFLLSFVQDTRTNKRVSEMVDQFFADKVKTRQKKDIAQEFFNKVQRNNDFQSFLESLLQVQGLKID